MFNTILLAIDDTPAGPAAVSFAIAMARSSGAPVHVIHVNEFVIAGRGHTVETPSEAAAVIEGALSELHEAGVTATGEVATANVFNTAPAIVNAAHESRADVIVVGSRRRHLLAGLGGPGRRERITALTSLPVMTAPAPLRVKRGGRLTSSEMPVRGAREHSAAVSGATGPQDLSAP